MSSQSNNSIPVPQGKIRIVFVGNDFLEETYQEDMNLGEILRSRGLFTADEIQVNKLGVVKVDQTLLAILGSLKEKNPTHTVSEMYIYGNRPKTSGG